MPCCGHAAAARAKGEASSLFIVTGLRRALFRSGCRRHVSCTNRCAGRHDATQIADSQASCR